MIVRCKDSSLNSMYSGTEGEVELQENKRPQAACCRHEVQSCSEMSCSMTAYVVACMANVDNPSNGRGRAAGDESREGWGNR